MFEVVLFLEDFFWNLNCNVLFFFGVGCLVFWVFFEGKKNIVYNIKEKGEC